MATLQRDGPTTPTVTLKSETDMGAMTLKDFDAYTREHPTWASAPGLAAAAVTELTKLLTWARGSADALTACGPQTVSALRATTLTAAVLARLDLYANAVTQTAKTVDVDPITDVPKALGWGTALETLEPEFSRPVLNKSMVQNATTTQLDDLIAGPYVADAIAYHKESQPTFEGEDGVDFKSYLLLRREGADPRTYRSQLPDVRNFHRFEKAMLDGLIANLAKTPGAQPMALILHTSHDHNGAFHRDPNLTALVQRAGYLTLMVEGATTLAAIEGRLPALGAAYGRRGKVAEIMVAGHGSSSSLELAGDPDTEAGKNENLSIGIDPMNPATVTRRARTQMFMNHLLDNMESSPDARLVLNACLTASNEVNAPLSDDPTVAAGQVNAAIAAQPSLATFAGQLATAKGVNVGVRGASGSFGQVALKDDAGRMDIKSDVDPQLTNPDKFSYVRHGTDPGGAGAAVLECWAIDQARTMQMVRERRDELASVVTVKGRAIHTIYSIVLDNPTNAPLINQLAHLGESLSEFGSDAQCQPGGWAAAGTLSRAVPAAHAGRIFTAMLDPAVTGRSRFAALSAGLAWAVIDPAKRGAYIDALGTFSCSESAPYIRMGWFAGDHSVKVMLGAGGSTAGQLRLALHSVKSLSPPDWDGATHLRRLLGAATTFPASSGVEAAIAGFSNEPEILRLIVRMPAGVTPITRTAAVTARDGLRIRTGPSTSAAIVTTLPTGATVDVVGQTGNWFAIYRNNRVQFMNKAWLNLS